MKTTTQPSPASSHARSLEYWQSLEHLASTPEIAERISKEFPGYDVDEMLSGSRRRFLKIMGASMALAGVSLTGCRRWPEEKLAPYSTNPRDRIPGVPEQYATAMEIGGVAMPLLVTSYDGRPIKVEGNPSHPFSWTVKHRIGAADALAQASVLEMYDPQRTRDVIRYGANPSPATAPAGETGAAPSDTGGASNNTPAPSNWAEFKKAADEHFSRLKGTAEGFAILSEASSSPSLLDMKKRLLAAYPLAKWYEYEPINRDNEVAGAKLAFGKAVRSVLHLDKAETVLCLDADLLGTHPAHVKNAADWAAMRRHVDSKKDASGKYKPVNRVYVVETAFSITGAIADVRLPVKPARLYAITRAVAAKLGVAGIPAEEKAGDDQKFVEAVVEELHKSGKNAIVAAGGAMPAAGVALVHAINAKLGAVGSTVTLVEDPTAPELLNLDAITTLSAEMKAGRVNTLLVVGGNPAYDAPADLGFGKLLALVPMSIHLAIYGNETSNLCKWSLPRAHYLESWGDARAWDGTAGVVQPLIMPLYEGKSAIEVLALLTGDSISEGHEIVLRTWAELLSSKNIGKDLRPIIEAGLADKTAFPAFSGEAKTIEYPAIAATDGFVLRFVSDSHVYDGRFANNGWLQETPDPLTKLVWDNAAMVAKADADKLGVTTGGKIRIETSEKFGKAAIELAAYVMPGQPVGVITLPLGYGRDVSAGHIGENLGFNTYTVRTSDNLAVGTNVSVTLTSGTYKLVSTQDHHILDTIGAEARDKRIGPKNHGGPIVHETTLTEYRKDPSSAHGTPARKQRIGLQLFQEPANLTDTHAWGMAIDMNACIGCNACAVACQAENNIPVVGKVQADMHRSMNWLRVDRYFKGDAEDPNIEVVYQPMMCQQCENAPCEQVCPVGATVHDTEGLNTMVYNRCIGTRYCSNNCPYKVRRFNYFDYHSQDVRETWGKPYLNIPDQQQLEQVDKIRRMMFNPEVTVRMRGVMEKCTYCVQRIHNATIAKRGQGGDVVDGDIVTACQQACPTQAIVFGNLNDPKSKVSQLHHSARSYGVLHEELDTRPRTQYLAKIRNVEEEVASARAVASGQLPVASENAAGA
jgi:molybdopterin-containing oxidoreductase family iron-sulfur binding subunit